MIDPSIKQLEALVSQGRYLEARELAAQLNGDGPATIRKEQLVALSLSKSGSPEAALAHLESQYRSNPNEPEAAGIMGSIYKELFKKHQDPKYAVLSRDTYSKNFAATKNYYTGINAATMSAIAGKSREARELAAEVIQLIGFDATSYWELATLGEAHLMINQRDKAVEFYVRARRLAGKDWGKVMSVYNQLWILNHYAQVPKDILKVFSPPGVAAFVGHMIDHPQRPDPRFPASIENDVKSAIKASIRSLNLAIGYCSLACGADILFAEAMEEAEGELRIFLPFAKSDFIRTSVAFAGQNWIDRFERIVASHAPAMITEESYNGYDELFEFQSKIVCGMSVLASNYYHQEPRLLTVLSQSDVRRRQGGTRAMLRRWPFPERHTNIDPDVMRPPGDGTVRESERRESIVLSQTRPLLHMVYADFSGVSPMDVVKINKVLSNNESVQVVPPRFYHREASFVFACYDGETEAIGLAHLLWTAIKPGTLNIALQSSAVDRASLENGGDEMLGVVKTIATLAPPGKVCAGQHFAALLALHPGSYELTYMGTVEGTKGIGQTVYQVTFKL